MNFASLEYLLFLAIVWGSYNLLPHRGQNFLLLIASYFFYGCWDWRFLSLIILSTSVDYVAGIILDSGTETARKRALVVSLSVNLGLLGVFKYLGFFIDSATYALNQLGFEASQPALHIVLPVGISFYTFQTMSYTIDVYRGKLQHTRNLLDFALFVAFFPQLVAGPIERAKHLLPILTKPRTITVGEVSRGMFLILLGLMKKIAIADGLSRSVDAIFTTEAALSPLDITLSTYAFAFQILGDFSAYTDIARGTSKLFGIDLMRNFDAPYFARSPSDFWRRWHISLSTWLRDYLYIPLGGNRGGNFSTYRNLMLTMVLGGLWHGAAGNFVLWGIYHGTLLCIFRFFQSNTADEHRPISQIPAASIYTWLIRVLSIATFFHLTCIGWLLFRAESFSQISYMFSVLSSTSGWTTSIIPRPPLGTLVGLLFLIPWEAMTYIHGKDSFYRAWPPVVRGVLIGLIVIIINMGLSNEASTFIYFQF
ncbi:MAG: MBOAT family protein [Myxococcales bacterium]|nr:MBOAT family protein [Myxococcales bacterium]